MKRTIIAFIAVCMACHTYALDPALWDICLRYKFPTAEDAWKVDRDKAGKAFIYDWKLPDAIPSEADLEAVSAPALVWWAEKQRAQKADFDTWDNQELKALIKVLLNEINILRQEVGLEPRTASQLKNAIQTNL